jgi:hypothetical protein
MLRVSFLFVPVILVGLAVFVIILIALFKSSSAGRWIFTALLAFLLFCCFFALLRRPRVIVHSEPPRAVSVAQVFDHSPAADPVVWQEDLEKELIPDVYSSLSRAAYGLGRQIQETIQEALWKTPEEILIVETPSLDKSVLNEFREGLKSQYEEANIYFGPLPANPVPSGTIRIMVSRSANTRHEVIRAADSDSVEQRFLSGDAGKVEAEVETEKGKYYKSVSFDYRPWLWDFNSFTSQVIPSGWMVFLSDQTAAGRQEARDQAVGKAIEMITTQIRNANPSSATFAHVTPEDLLQNGFFADEYSQQLAGLAGPIWRHAILLDVSPDRLTTLSSEKIKIDRQVRMTWAKTLGSLAGMIVLVCVVYAIANAATKGYYSAVLAVTAVLAAVILGFLILLMTKAGGCT